MSDTHRPKPIPEGLDRIARQVVDAAYVVHNELGPGLLESLYEVCLCEELQDRGIKVIRQAPLAVTFRGKRIDAGFRVDLLIGDEIIVELKSVDAVLPIHKAQILTYLRLASKRLGFLINFNVPMIKAGIQRFAL